MVDNVTLNSGSGGAVLATDDISSVHYQRVKVNFGADGSATDVSSANPLPVDFPDFVEDSNNTSTTPLAGNADFTGTATDLSAYAGITVNIFADQDSDASGMKFQFSSDGTNWDIDVAGGFDYLASTGRQFQFPCFSQYFRVVFQNGASAQSAFRIQTLLHHHSISLTSIHRLDADIKPDRSCELVKAAIIAQVNGSGDFVPVQSTASGILKIGGSVDIDSSALPTGGARAANQTTIIGHLDGVEGLLTTIDADTGNIATAASAIQTAVELIDNAISGSEMQVDIVASLPAGTNAIGKLAANSGVDIGDVDVTSISAGSNLIGDVGLSGARTSGGTTPFFTKTATLQAVKASAGQVFWIHCMNLTAAKAYLQVFNAATGSVTLGTTAPTLEFALPTQGDANGAGFAITIPNGIAFGTAISIAITSDESGSTTLASGNCITNIGYA